MKHIRIYIACALVCGSAFGVLSFTEAHGDSESFEVSVGEYIVDIGYNRALEATVPILFDLGIKRSDQTSVPFTDAWIRLSQGDQTKFSAPVFNGALGGARVTYVFPIGGEYVATVRFYDHGKELATTDIPILVSTGDTEDRFSLLTLVLVGIGSAILAGVAAWLVFSRMPRHP